MKKTFSRGAAFSLLVIGFLLGLLVPSRIEIKHERTVWKEIEECEARGGELNVYHWPKNQSFRTRVVCEVEQEIRP